MNEKTPTDGFVQVPDEVFYDKTLSMGARLTYSMLLRLAFREGRKRGDETIPVNLPPYDTLARMIGCATTTVKSYVGELRARRVVVTKRIGNKGLVYFLFESPATDEKLASVSRILANKKKTNRTDSVLRNRPDSDPLAGAVLSYREATTERDSLTGVRGRPVPPVHIVGRQNEPLNALRDVCNIDPANSARMPELAAALMGRGGRKGIRDLFWVECCRYAAQSGREAELDAITPEQYAHLLVEQIPRKARLYEERMPGAMLTPSALLKYWLDLERMKPREGGMTPDEVKRVADAA